MKHLEIELNNKAIFIYYLHQAKSHNTDSVEHNPEGLYPKVVEGFRDSVCFFIYFTRFLIKRLSLPRENNNT